DRLRSLPEITIYGEADPQRTQERVGVISFNLGSANHALVAAVLGYEGGIGVRSGCFCAQPYVASLLREGENEKAQWGRDPLAGDNSGKPGMVRISFGAYNSFDDVDALVEMLRRITRMPVLSRCGAARSRRRLQPGSFARMSKLIILATLRSES